MSCYNKINQKKKKTQVYKKYDCFENVRSEYIIQKSLNIGANTFVPRTYGMLI